MIEGVRKKTRALTNVQTVAEQNSLPLACLQNVRDGDIILTAAKSKRNIIKHYDEDKGGWQPSIPVSYLKRVKKADIDSLIGMWKVKMGDESTEGPIHTADNLHIERAKQMLRECHENDGKLQTQLEPFFQAYDTNGPRS